MNHVNDTLNGENNVHLPLADTDSASGTSRREFLKVLGVAGAGAAAVSCGPPDTGDKLLPYLVSPEEIIPGTNTEYASVLRAGGPEPLGLRATVRDGRVIKLEGNPAFPSNRGRLSALAQSALQDLYDPDRVPGPMRGGQETDWETVIEALAAEVTSSAGDVVLLTEPVTGTNQAFLRQWAESVGAEHIAYEPFGLETLRTANGIAFGLEEIPRYELEKADVVVSFGADFLETWIAPVELAARYAISRDIERGNLPRFTWVGPRLSLTGTNADQWIGARAGTEGLVALAVARVVADVKGGGPAARVASALARYTPEAAARMAGVSEQQIQDLGEQIAAARAPVALPPGIGAQGETSTDAHIAVAILNYVSGAVGNTMIFGAGAVRGTSASYGTMASLARRMAAGEVGTLIVAGTNPAYSLPASTGFVDALANVTNVVSLNPHADETTAAADWVLPSNHELESWNDCEFRPAAVALAQPVMRPVFNTMQREDILLQVANAAGVGDAFGADTYHDYLQNAWRELHQVRGADVPFDEWWRKMLSVGGLLDVSDTEATAPPITAAAANYGFTPLAVPEGFTLVTYPTLQFYDGRGANRSWIQELPDPITKAVWTSWIEIHPDVAEPLGVTTGDIVEVRTSAGFARAPAYLNSAMRPDTIAVPLGQGHTAYGRNAIGRGINALDMLDGTLDGRSGALAYVGASATLTATGERGKLVILQGSHSDHDRQIMETMGYEEATAAIEGHHVDLTELVKAAYDSDPNSPYRWGMTIDLNSCTGCGACAIACSAENNIPSVGEDLCAQGRDMSWMQIWRSEDPLADGGVKSFHEPLLCQHCGDAPCEPVCPVYATYHNPEGLNVQVYNRCVGTRYCANNCPYKVRRFNWYTYEHPYPMNLQLNPDVTVRQRGVMEKCNFCVQRINRAKIEAKQDGRLVADGAIQTACMQSCPTNAIVFGNLKDPDSRVSRTAKGARAYHYLGELNTRPAVTYLKAVTHAEMQQADHGGGHAEGSEEGDD